MALQIAAIEDKKAMLPLTALNTATNANGTGEQRNRRKKLQRINAPAHLNLSDFQGLTTREKFLLLAQH